MEEAAMAQHRAPSKHVGTWTVITVLLAAALIGTLWVPFYNDLTPVLGGFPFFYWYQLLWVPIVAILAAARWRQAEDRLHLNEWGLGGRGFGIFITWFLLGGDIYTAYTFIAVPALVYGVGALGFFAVPYTIIVFPIVFVFAPRLWSVSRVHGYVTPADFVRGRYGSHGLALAVAVTGILATMPYIALQLVGIQAVLTVL